MFGYSEVIIKGKKVLIPIFQGGMGVGVSRWFLAAWVALQDGVGIISTAGLDRLVSQEIGRKVNTYEAVYIEVTKAREFSHNGLIGVNIMVFLQRDWEMAVKGAIAAGADFIISGAGIPINLPAIDNPRNTALIPIVSSLRVLKIIQDKWEKLKYRPDAIVIEGPLAGGHLGFKLEDLEKVENRLENLLLPIKDFAMKNGDYPVIVAGGIHDRDDILSFLSIGADAVQMGTRFLATEESGASERYKLAVVNSSAKNIAVVKNSPCGFPFRVITDAPQYQRLITSTEKNICDKGYLLQKDKDGNHTICAAKNNPQDYFCICNGLLDAVADELGDDLYTVGAQADRITEITTVKKLMNELKGLT